MRVTEKILFQRPGEQEKTFHRLPAPIQGQQIRFENVAPEEPIGELSAYNVAPGVEPQGSARLVYTLGTNTLPTGSGIESIKRFIAGRYAADERAIILAIGDEDRMFNSQSEIQSARLPSPYPDSGRRLAEHDGWPRRHRHRSSGTQSKAYAWRLLSAEHSGKGSAVAAAKSARLQLLPKPW